MHTICDSQPYSLDCIYVYTYTYTKQYKQYSIMCSWISTVLHTSLTSKQMSIKYKRFNVHSKSTIEH